MIGALARVCATIVLVAAGTIIDYRKPVEKAFMSAGFRVIFVSTKIQDGEQPESRPKIMKTKCGDKAFWTPRLSDNIMVWLSPECEHGELVKAAAIFGEDVQKWVKDHAEIESTKTIGSFTVDVRKQKPEGWKLTVKKIDPFQNR